MGAREDYTRALAVHDSLGDAREIGRSLNNLATVHRDGGDYRTAIRLFLEARQAYGEADFVEGQAWLDFSVGVLYKKIGDYEQALASMHSSLETYRSIARSDSAGVMICYGQLGDIHLLQGEPHEGLRYQLRALEMRQSTGVRPAIADGHTGVAKAYFDLGDYDKARRHFQRSEALREGADSKRGRTTNLLYLARIARARDEPRQALSHLQEALRVSRGLEDRDAESSVLRALADLHAAQGRYEQAWAAEREHDDVRKLEINIEIAHRVATIQLQHDIATQTAENERLLRENRIKDLQLERSRAYTAISVVGAVAAIVLGSVLLVLQRKRAQLKTLSGLLPICSHCKKIRNDAGYFEQLEKYITEHSDAQFSHSICDECGPKYYGEYFTPSEPTRP